MFFDLVIISLLEVFAVLGSRAAYRRLQYTHLNSHPHSIQLPIIHHLTSKISGSPTKSERFLASKSITGIRKIVSTSSFEHVIQGLWTKNSRIRKSLKTSFLKKAA
jgi:hypothetical protein